MPSHLVPISVLFYNCHLFGDTGLAGFLAAFQRLTGGSPFTFSEFERADHIAKAIRSTAIRHNLDVVGLCEVWDDALARRIIMRLKDTFQYHYRPRMRSRPDCPHHAFGSGLLILSRRPHTRVGFRMFDPSAAGSFDMYAQKGFLRIALETPRRSQSLMLVCTHLQSGESLAAKAVRAGQLVQVARSVGAARRYRRFRDCTVILMGDLNVAGERGPEMLPTNEYVETLRNLSMRDAFRTAHPAARAAPGFTSDAVDNELLRYFYGDTGLRRRLDYILWHDPCDRTILTTCETERFATNPSTEGKKNGIRDLSDHFALRATFEMRID